MGEVKELLQESQKVGSWRDGTRVNLIKYMGKIKLVHVAYSLGKRI